MLSSETLCLRAAKQPGRGGRARGSSKLGGGGGRGLGSNLGCSPGYWEQRRQGAPGNGIFISTCGCPQKQPLKTYLSPNEGGKEEKHILQLNNKESLHLSRALGQTHPQLERKNRPAIESCQEACLRLRFVTPGLSTAFTMINHLAGPGKTDPPVHKHQARTGESRKTFHFNCKFWTTGQLPCRPCPQSL